MLDSLLGTLNLIARETDSIKFKKHRTPVTSSPVPTYFHQLLFRKQLTLYLFRFNSGYLDHLIISFLFSDLLPYDHLLPSSLLLDFHSFKHEQFPVDFTFSACPLTRLHHLIFPFIATSRRFYSPTNFRN